MKKIYSFLIFIFLNTISAQPIDNLFALTNKNLPSTNNNTNSLLRLSGINVTTGFVNNIGAGVNLTNGGFTVAGGCVNQVNNTFNILNSTLLRSFDLNTGNIIQQTPITSFAPNTTTYFDQVRFNNSNTTLYGLARVAITSQNQLTYLAKLDTTTGNLIQISQTPLSGNQALNGTVIDPDEMIYYYTSGSKFVGLDLYNGSVYSNPDYVFSNPEYFGFANIALNCSDGQIYGLIRGRTPGQNPVFPSNFIYYLRFGKINPTTGVVTVLSTVNLPTISYSLNASSAIDETNGVYYFSNNNNIYGVSLNTGLIVTASPITFEDGNVLNFISSYNNCINRTATRQNPALQTNSNLLLENSYSVYPNPATNLLFIKTGTTIEKSEIYDINGRLIISTYDKKAINIENLLAGVYLIKIYSENQILTRKFIKAN